MVKIVLMIGKLALVFVAVGLLGSIVENLQKIVDFKFDKKAIETQVGVIMEAATYTIAAVFDTKGKGKGSITQLIAFENLVDDLEDVADMFEDMTDYISDIVECMNDIEKPKKDTIKLLFGDSSTPGSESFFGQLTTILETLNEKKLNTGQFNGNIKAINTLSDTLKNLGKAFGFNFESGISSTIKFMDKVNTVKVENIEKTAKMFEKMSEFSKSIHGNFEGLADTLNDKITPLLEKIDTTLKNTESSLAKANQSLQETSDKVSGISAVTGADAMVKTTKDKDGKAVTTVDPKGLANAISGIGASISEIRKTISKFDKTIIADGLDQAVKTVNKPTS